MVGGTADTWMHERYGCDGTMQTNRTAAYFEYPSTVAILNREIRYGIEIDFKKVTVRTNAFLLCVSVARLFAAERGQ